MMVKCEIPLENFKPWSGARDIFNKIVNEGKLSQLELMLEDFYPYGIEDGELNDLLWFDSDRVLKYLGIRTYNQIEDELDDAWCELEDLQSGFEMRTCDEDMTVEEKQEIYESDYRNDIEYWQEKIAELEEELDAV